MGIVSKSGTLSYEAVGATTRQGLGQSLCVGVGGDMLPGTSLREGLEVLLRHEGTKGVVVLGEIGGEAEMEAADFLSRWNASSEEREGRERKPVVGMITGRTAPRGRVMGHAGAGEFLPFLPFPPPFHPSLLPNTSPTLAIPPPLSHNIPQRRSKR